MTSITGVLTRSVWGLLLTASSSLPAVGIVTATDPLAAEPAEYDVLYVATRGDKITFLGERFDESIVRTSSTGEAAPESSPSDNGDVWKMATEPAPYVGAGCCDPAGCGCPSSCCPPPCCPPPCCVPTYWLGGVEATFLAADVNDGAVGYQLNDNLAAPVVDNRVASPDLDNFYVAPRLWLGVQHGCWGVMARYWHLRAHEGAYDPFISSTIHSEGIPNFGYDAYNQLEMYTVDVEGTYSFCHCDCRNIMTFGARHASLENTNGLSSFATVNDGASGTGLLTSRAYANRTAYGTGVTGSWQGRKPLFCGSCVHLIGGLRGSMLWGCTHVNAETGVSEMTPSGPAGAASFNRAAASTDDSIFIGEAIGGLQWDYRVICFPADAFFRVVFEYQYWNTGDGTAQAGSFAGFGTSPNNSQGTATASAAGQELDLYGVSVGTGFTW